MTSAMAEHSIQINGAQIRYQEAGQGNPVVLLRSAQEGPESPFQIRLAHRFRVIAVAVPDLPAQEQASAAQALNQAIAQIGLDHYVLIGSADSASLALWQAIDAPDRIDGLVLLSPRVLASEERSTANDVAPDPGLADRLAEVRAATLVLFGTNDMAISPQTGRQYVEQLPDCYYALVYDAGHDIASDRPEALAEAVCDFIERRGTFIVERNSTAISP